MTKLAPSLPGRCVAFALAFLAACSAGQPAAELKGRQVPATLDDAPALLIDPASAAAGLIPSGEDGAPTALSRSTGPRDVTPQAVLEAAITTATPLEAEAEVSTHSVVPGDTLTRIADRYGVSVAALLAANDLPNPDLLEVGQIINLPLAPVAYTASFRSLPDSRLVRSIGASDFAVGEFVQTQAGVLRRMSLSLNRRRADGSEESARLTAGQVVERVSQEFSVDARILLAFLEYFAGLLSRPDVEADLQQYPLLAKPAEGGIDRAGLYLQLSWLADTLNRGYYDRKYRGKTILEFDDGSRLNYDKALNAGTAALQYALAQLRDLGQWEIDIGEGGLHATYKRLFGDPFAAAPAIMPKDWTQPKMNLPFARGEIWRFTGGFHGGWGNGSGWAAIDFAPPPEDRPTGACYVSSHPAVAVADGVIARMAEGLVILDLDLDADESTGWTVLYLHIDVHDALREGQAVSAGNILGYPSCKGGFSTATHLHIARRFNGEWIPADCNRCPAAQNPPPFVMSGWRVVGLGSQLYQGFIVRDADDHTVIAEQGRFTDINEISW